MSTPTYPVPEPPPPSKPRNNTLLWVIVIVAVGGLCVGVLFMAAILFPVFSSARFAAQRTACMSNQKRAAMAMLVYSVDFDNRLPPGDRWVDVGIEYSEGSAEFACPLVVRENGPGRSGYAMNQAVAGKSVEVDVPAETVMLFESNDVEKNAVGGEGDVCKPGRHARRNAFAFCDGHVRSIPDVPQPDASPFVRRWSP